MMGLYVFRLPDIGEGIAEAEITAWHVKPGDRISEDQPLVDVMTDKAVVDISSPVDGVVKAIYGDKGTKAPVGSVLVELEIEGHVEMTAIEPTKGQIQKPTDAAAQAVHQTIPDKVVANQRPHVPPTEANNAIANADPSASPSTRRRAMEWGIELENVIGTGPNGRILLEDLERFRGAQNKKAVRSRVDEVNIIGLRRRIAERMSESKRQIPHFSYVEELDLTELENLRAELNRDRGERPKLTLLPFFMCALAKLIPQYPDVNAHYNEEKGLLRRFSTIHVGIATQTKEGLMVPVVRHVEARGLWECAAELTRVTEAARLGTAKRDELSGSTITLTSLGALGGLAATPIINHPETAIIGPNKLREEPVIDGAFIARRKRLNLSSSFDHRIVDGYVAARFVQELKRLMEHPALLFLDT
jgi:2-oxoisovalerate dehydrogenase E2 component (dihydrolipoyl transacylase)